MKNLLYIGNNLSTKNNNTSSIQTLGRLLESEGYQLRYASKYKNKALRLLDMLWSCFKYMKWANAVIIDTYSTQNFYYALFCSQLCRLLRLPYFTSLNGGNLPQRLKKNPRLSGFIFNNAAQNISPSIYLKKEFEAQGYLDIKHISNTIVIKNYPLHTKGFELIRLLWVRSFSKIYNPQMAVKVQKKLMDMGYAAELCMIGPDSDGSLNQVKALAKALNTDTKFTGKLTKSEWIEKSKNSNIFINTTDFDNTPVSVIEAMALGLPVVSTNVGGMPYLIDNEKEGILVEKGDVDAMVNAIIRIFKEKALRDTLILNARIKTETFDWSVVKQQWNSVLR